MTGAPGVARGRRPVDLRFEWATTAAGAWLLGGAYLDGWAHNHIPALETFLTPWHAVLYSGFAAVTGLTLGRAIRGRAAGRPWSEALPRAYRASLAGIGIFAAGGVADAVWHTLFGIEIDVETLVSPPHLLLALGAVLILGGPLRAAWGRAEARPGGWAVHLPAILSLAFVLSIFTFFTQHLHPLGRPWPAPGNRPTSVWFSVVAPDPLLAARSIHATFVAHSVGVGAVLLQAGLLMGLLLLSLRRWRWWLPPGTLTVVFTLNALLMGLMRDEAVLAPGALLAGLAGDLLLVRLRPSPHRMGALRLFAFAVPFVSQSLYLLTVLLTKGLWWSVHLCAGSAVLAGTTGWLLSYLVASPEESARPVS
jgi:hypothetical protein